MYFLHSERYASTFTMESPVCLKTADHCRSARNPQITPWKPQITANYRKSSEASYVAQLCRQQKGFLLFTRGEWRVMFYQKTFRNHSNLNCDRIFRAKRQLSLIRLSRTAALPAALSNLTRPCILAICGFYMFGVVLCMFYVCIVICGGLRITLCGSAVICGDLRFSGRPWSPYCQQIACKSGQNSSSSSSGMSANFNKLKALALKLGVW